MGKSPEHRFLDALEEPAAFVDASGNIEASNDAACQTCGLSHSLRSAIALARQSQAWHALIDRASTLDHWSGWLPAGPLDGHRQDIEATVTRLESEVGSRSKFLIRLKQCHADDRESESLEASMLSLGKSISRAGALVLLIDSRSVLRLAELDGTDLTSSGEGLSRELDANTRLTAGVASALEGETSRLTLPLGDKVFDLVCAPLVTNGGKVQGAVGIGIDVTHRQNLENALRTTEDQYNMIMQQRLMSVVLIGENGQIMEFNPASEELTGIRRQDILGCHYADAFIQMVPEQMRTRERKRRDREAIDAALKSGKPTHEAPREFQYQRRDGSLGWVEQVVFPIKTSKGYRMTVIAHDITEKKRLEAQLLQSAKMEAVGRLAGGIAHDFNNLLTVIRGNVSLAMPGLPPNSPLEAMLTDVQRAADSAGALTRQLLAFSRKQIVEPKTLNLNDVVSGLNTMLRRLLGEEVKMRTNLDPHIGTVRIDPGQIEQVLINLAVNGRDAMPNGGSTTIETANISLDQAACSDQPGTAPGPYVMLAVSDSGVGLAPEARAHLFEPFFTTKEKGKGTGLGLATIYGAVTQAGGLVTVSSELGHGTTFRIYLPMISAAVVPSVRPEVPDILARGTETILLVEDEELVRNAGTRLLQSLGYHVLSASDGYEALKVAEQHQGLIHLRLTDVVMPEMNGKQLADKLAQSRPGITVIYASGYTENTIADRGVLHENLNFIAKPFTRQQLAEKLKAVMRTAGKGHP